MSATSTTPVVLLHGVGLDRTMWAAARRELAARSHDAIAIDLPGHGRRPPLRRPVRLAELADDVRSRLPAGRVHLVGFSLGALIAQAVAIDSPELVATLTCVSSVCRRTPEERAAVLQRLASARVDFAATVERSLTRWYEGTDVPTGTVEATRTVLARNDVESFLRAYEVFATGDVDVADGLAGITAPTAVITGGLDPGSTPAMSERLQASIPNATLRVVPGVRHMLPVQAPSVLADDLAGLIDQGEGHD